MAARHVVESFLSMPGYESGKKDNTVLTCPGSLRSDVDVMMSSIGDTQHSENGIGLVIMICSHFVDIAPAVPAHFQACDWSQLKCTRPLRICTMCNRIMSWCSMQGACLPYIWSSCRIEMCCSTSIGLQGMVRQHCFTGGFMHASAV